MIIKTRLKKNISGIKRSWTQKCMLIATLFLFTFSGLYSQSTTTSNTVNIHMQDVLLKDLLKEIETQTRYFFLYDKKNVDENRKVSVSADNRPLTEVLNRVFSDTNVTYTVEGNHIVLSRRSEEQHTINQQGGEKTIAGTIKDESNEPVIGATITVAGTSLGTISDFDGNFSLAGVPENGTINVSYIGFLTQTINLQGRSSFNIVLKEDAKALDEVIVIGYGTTTRRHVVGAVGQVNAQAIEDRPVANVTQALQGAAANLVIQQRNMDPNNNTMNINIRGISTMNDNSPLIVIDGMISDVGAMNSLNPNDIENISILKDAGSAAIYGSRSANGVILVTTKMGKKDMKPTVRFGASVGSQVPEVLAKPAKGYINALLRNDAYVNSGLEPIYTSQQIQQFADGGDSEYFLKQILKNALQQNYNVSVQGGSSNTTYMVSAAYFDQESNFKGPDYGIKRYNVRSNLSTEFGRFKLTSLMAYSRNEGMAYQGDNGFLIANAARVPVYNTYMMKDGDGRYYANDVLTGGNPLLSLEKEGYSKSDNDNFQGSINAELKIIEGLKAKAMMGLDMRSEHRLIRRYYWPVYMSTEDINPINTNNSRENHIEDYGGKITFLNTLFSLDYNRTFAGAHNITALAAFSNESYRSQRHEIKKKYVDPVLGIPITGTEVSEDSYNTPNGTTERSIYSWFGRIGYSYMDKYYGEVNMRYDGSSKFSTAQRWGFFPSFTLGWRPSEENFMSFWKENIGDMKIRGSYGVLGNQNVPDYEYFTTYTIYKNQYGFNNTPVSGTGYTFGNDGLHWESSANLNVGADLAFFNNALTASFDYFNNTTSGILLKPQAPGTLGGAVANANMGKMRNQGWEVTLNYRLLHGDFRHNFGFNIGDSFNKVLEFEGFEQISKSDEIERIIREGLPLYCYYGYKTDGFFQNEEDVKSSPLPIGASVQPGDVKYQDRNNDGIIDDNDRYVLGHAFPRYTFGFNYEFSWKGLDFGVFFQGVGKRDMALRGELIEPYHGNYSYVIFEHQLDYWSPANTDARWPRLSAPSTPSTENNYGKGSDLQIMNAAYLRLKNIQIGYTLPKEWTTKIGMQKARIYATGQNLFTLSHLSFIDPEISEFGSNMDAGGANSGRNYPLLRYFGIGIDIEF